MTILGEMNKLTIKSIGENEWVLDGEEYGDLLLRRGGTLQLRGMTRAAEVGEQIEVFVYRDAKDKIAVTDKKPKVAENEFARLEVVDITGVGAFLDWGLPKNLFIPFAEQRRPLEVGQKVIVYVTRNHADNRMMASTKFEKFLNRTPAQYHMGQEVSLLFAQKTDLGYKAIVNNQHWGVLHTQDIFKSIHPGEKATGYIKRVKEEDKIDVMLTPPGTQNFSKLTDRILKKLQQSNGFLAISDKSSPELIAEVFSVSKKQFKNAIGQLYKKHLITIDKSGISLNKKGSSDRYTY